MKSTVVCFDVTASKNIVTVSKLSIHAGCYGVSMFDPKTPMCACACVCALNHQNIETSKQIRKNIIKTTT